MISSCRFLLDTNVLSHLLKYPTGPVAHKVAEVGIDAVGTSVVVASELRFGGVKGQSSRQMRKIEGLLDTILVLSLAPPADEHYARTRASLEAAGTPIGANDLLIAAQALAAGQVVVTANLREFRRVPGLPVEDWSAAAV